jgi:ParB-like chromosome segregation protein Spo0J
MQKKLKAMVAAVVAEIEKMPLAKKVDSLNEVRRMLHAVSPFAAEPVDCIQWVPISEVEANDYNPNSVAPPEMALLQHSIASDGYTQPIVAWSHDGIHEVVDGFHRNRVGRECPEVASRIHGYLPLAVIKPDREGRNDRIASTIRHNRARGKHAVSSMSEIVIELKRRNWSDKKIGKELGMDPDEVLRLSQISGLMEAFQNTEFTEAWEVVEDDGTDGVEK